MRASFDTIGKIAYVTLSISSPMPEHWPDLNDPHLDGLGYETSPHASEAWAERRNRRLRVNNETARSSDSVQSLRSPKCESHTHTDQGWDHFLNLEAPDPEKRDMIVSPKTTIVMTSISLAVLMLNTPGLMGYALFFD